MLRPPLRRGAEVTGWLNGDFDGNGSVNFDDYSLIDLAFDTQVSPLRSGVIADRAKGGKAGPRAAVI